MKKLIIVLSIFAYGCAGTRRVEPKFLALVDNGVDLVHFREDGKLDWFEPKDRVAISMFRIIQQKQAEIEALTKQLEEFKPKIAAPAKAAVKK